jgi:hypothetical protein
MSTQIILGQSTFTIRGADHLQVDGGLVQIQRSSPTGFETVAVAGEGVLVTIEPVQCAKVEIRDRNEASRNGQEWHPTGDPLD